MLADRERKLLRILNNYSLAKRIMPTLKQLQIKTGLSESQLLIALNNLEDSGFIEWTRKPITYEIVILRAWEEEPVKSRRRDNGRYLDYLTEY